MNLLVIGCRTLAFLAGCLTIAIINRSPRLTQEMQKEKLITFPAIVGRDFHMGATNGAQSFESGAVKLRHLPIEKQLTAWNETCKELIKQGKWQDAIKLALLAPGIENLDPLGEVLQILAVSNPLEVSRWMESEIGAGNSRMSPALSELMRQWSHNDPSSCMEAARRIDSTKFSFASVVMEVLSKNPDALITEDLLKAIPEKEDPRETIRTISYYLSAGDPAKAMEWAKSLETPAQRSYAVVEIANSAARQNLPEAWDFIARLKAPENRETAASLWGDKVYDLNPADSVQKLGSIPDTTLIASAAKGMLAKAIGSDFAKAFELAETMKSSGIYEGSLEQLIMQTHIPPEAWIDNSGDARLSMLENLSAQQKNTLYMAAAKLIGEVKTQ